MRGAGNNFQFGVGVVLSSRMRPEVPGGLFALVFNYTVTFVLSFTWEMLEIGAK
jgi:hypothetical protein